MKFNVDSQLLLYSLGEDAVESDSIAIIELIKNGVDARAKNIVLDLTKILDNEIKITDNGDGMSREEVEDHWFEIASSFKADHPQLLGGKGVGRFSFFRFADKIQVQTTKGRQTTEFSIDRKTLEQEKNLSKTEFPVYTYKSNNNDGTIITLSNFKHRIDLHEIEISTQNLFLDKNKIKLDILYPSEYQTKNYMNPEDIFRHVTLDATIKIKDGIVTHLNILGQHHGVKYILDDKINNFQNLIDDIHKIDELGEISFRVTNFYFDNTYSDLSSSDRNHIRKHFLSAYQGINIYRNNVKIHGHGKNDWLKLAESRVQSTSMYLDNKMTYGYIILDSTTEKKLIEKTNRENFKRNDFSICLATLSKLIMKYLSKLRAQFAKDVIRKDSRKSSELENKIAQNEEQNTSKSNIPIDDNKNTDTLQNTNDIEKEKLKGQEEKKKKEKKEEKQQEKEKEKYKEQEQEEQEKQKKKAKSHLDNECIIDKSFTVHSNTPEKIKSVIEELKSVRKSNLYSQALLLRCLIDISTDYFQTQYDVEKANNNLPKNIRASLDYINNKRLLDHKVVSRIRNHVNKEKMTDFFNGVAHEYNYKPTHSELIDIWDIIDPYISLCIHPKD